MGRLLDQRPDGYELVHVERLEDLDFDRLVPMIDRAWSADYVGEPREDFNENLLRKLLRGDCWLAVLARHNGAPVGIELALQRSLRVGGTELEAFYVTAFSVDPNHRRRGLGRWVLDGINRCVFEERGADLIFSTFHEGHAGSPAVQSTFDRIEGWAVERFHASDVWSQRLREAPGAAEAGVRGRRIWCTDIDPERLEGEGAGGTDSLPTSAELDCALRQRFDVSFAMTASLRSQYLHPDGTESGTLHYRFEDGAEAFSCYNLLPLKRDRKLLLPVGQLQLVWGDISDDQLRQVVVDSSRYLAELGCFAVNLVDMGLVPRPLLRDLGFAPLDDEHIVFAVRGPKAATQKLRGVSPPFFLDFT